MSHHFLQISLEPKEGFEESAFLESLNEAEDWIKYMDHCWIVKTTRSARETYRSLKPTLNGSRVFVIKVDMEDRQGWMPTLFWEWLKKPLDSNT